MNKCIYFVEGQCEELLVKALRQQPARLIPGRVKVLNPIQNWIPKSILLTIEPGMTVVLVYDTDKPEMEILLRNIELLKHSCVKVRLIHLMQVRSLEDELVRCTDVREAMELTKSATKKDFKSDFCKLSPQSCRQLLERHRLDANKLWTTSAPAPFDKFVSNRDKVKA